MSDNGLHVSMLKSIHTEHTNEHARSVEELELALAEMTAQRDHYFQELYKESRQSYVYANLLQRTRQELMNIHAKLSWRLMLPFRKVEDLIHRLLNE